MRGHELFARVTAGLAQFLPNVAQGIHAHRFGGETLQFQVRNEVRLADQAGHGDAQRGSNLLHNRVRLGCDRGHVQRLFSAANAQKAGGLLENLGADPRDGAKFETRPEASVLIAVLHDLKRNTFGNSGDVP